MSYDISDIAVRLSKVFENESYDSISHNIGTEDSSIGKFLVLLYSSVSVPEITASTSTPSLMRSCPSVTT